MVLLAGCGVQEPGSRGRNTDKMWKDRPLTPNAIKTDIEYLFSTIEEVHPNMYAYIDRKEFAKRKESLCRRIVRPMTRNEFFTQIAPLVAELMSDHTHVLPPVEEYRKYLSSGGKVFPLALRSDGSNVYLAEDATESGFPVNTIILEINGLAATELAKRLADGMTFEGKRGSLETRIRLAVQSGLWRLYLWFEFGASPSWVVLGKSRREESHCYRIDGTTLDEITGRISTTMGSKESASFFRSKACIILLRNMYGRAEAARFEEFSQFLRNTFKDIAEKHVSNLIIDVRGNPGGSSESGEELLKYLTDKPFRQFEEVHVKISRHIFGNNRNPSRAGEQMRCAKKGTIVKQDIPFVVPVPNPYRFRGRLFVLTGPGTSSSAADFTSTIKKFTMGTIIGEETGGRCRSYGDSLSFTLPNSGLEFRVPCKYFINAHGTDTAGGVRPDYVIRQESNDVMKGADPVMEHALRLSEVHHDSD